MGEIEQKQKSYQDVMDQMTAPDALVESTLQSMYKEIDTRYAERKRKSLFRAAESLIGIAAVLLIMVAVRYNFVSTPKLNQDVTFNVVEMSSLPQIMYNMRGDSSDDAVETIEEQMQIPMSDFIPDYELQYSEAGEIRTSQGDLLRRVYVEYGNADQKKVSMEFGDHDLVMFTVISGFEPVKYNDTEVRFAKDKDSDLLYAIWKVGDIRCVLGSEDLTQGEFGQLVQRVVKH